MKKLLVTAMEGTFSAAWRTAVVAETVLWAVVFDADLLPLEDS